MIKTILSAVLIGASLLSFGCKDKDNDPVNCNWGTELQAEVNAVTTAQTNYVNNPTTATCNAYVASLNSYLDALAGFESCATTGGTHAEWEAALSSYQASVDAIQC